MATEFADFRARFFLTALLYRGAAAWIVKTDPYREARLWELLSAGSLVLLIIGAWFVGSKVISAGIMLAIACIGAYVCYLAVARRSTYVWSFVALQAVNAVGACFPVSGLHGQTTAGWMVARFDRIAYGVLVIVALLVVAVLERNPTKTPNAPTEGDQGRGADTD